MSLVELNKSKIRAINILKYDFNKHGGKSKSAYVQPLLDIHIISVLRGPSLLDAYQLKKLNIDRI